MNKKTFIFLFLVSFIVLTPFAGAKEESNLSKRVLVIREGRQIRRDIVAVEASILDGIMDVKVEARMLRERPKISNVLLVGPRIGRVYYETKRVLPPIIEEEEPYPIRIAGGLISFGEKTETKKPKGTLAKELFKIRVPVKKIIPGKRYQIWVVLESKTRGGQGGEKFKFNLDNFSSFINN